ncbi:hypothetical protein PsorP6_006737 [Peronosclerospora sorghi]|uniref:Uncharacterized protein n=1 Tax=Peronosclerospora sorghi TaxID=230839 RepID=A0ACC0W3V7_9STRA|nr:hypothetical protein PsorP6_006737 [Peronosclerospora sorghi]
MYNVHNFGAQRLVKVMTSVMNGEEKLFASITAAKAHSLLRERALKVNKSLIDEWKREKHLNPEILLHRLGIEQSLDQLISLEEVRNYIAYYNSQIRKSSSRWFDGLRRPSTRMYWRGGWSRQRGWTLQRRSRRHCSKNS